MMGLRKDVLVLMRCVVLSYGVLRCVTSSCLPCHGCDALRHSLADLLGLQAPTLPTAASLAKTSLQIVDGGSAFRPTDEYDVASGIWDDEEEKRFYEDIVDLADEVPGVLLGLSGDGGAPTAAPAADSAGQPEPEPLARVSSRTSEGPEADEGEGRLAELALEDKAELDADPDADADAEPIPSGPAARLNAIFAALPEASNRSLIDKLAVEFAFLNNKGARKRMYKVGPGRAIAARVQLKATACARSSSARCQRIARTCYRITHGSRRRSTNTCRMSGWD